MLGTPFCDLAGLAFDLAKRCVQVKAEACDGWETTVRRPQPAGRRPDHPPPQQPTFDHEDQITDRLRAIDRDNACRVEHGP